MTLRNRAAIFWDYENIRAPSSISGNVLAGNIRSVAHNYGSLYVFLAYIDLSQFVSSKSAAHHSILQTPDVTLVDCPHNGRKDVADKMIIVDMLAFALDHPPPATIILISGDHGFAYAVSILRLRGYNVVLIAPKSASNSIKSVSSLVLDWDSDVLGRATNTSSVLWGRHSRDDSGISDILDDVDVLTERATSPSMVAELAPTVVEPNPPNKVVGKTVPDTTASLPNKPASLPTPTIHVDRDGLYDLRQTILPWNVFKHLLTDSRPGSPAPSETALSDVSTASYLTSDTLVGPCSSSAQFPVPPLSAAAPFSESARVSVAADAEVQGLTTEVTEGIGLVPTNSYSFAQGFPQEDSAHEAASAVPEDTESEGAALHVNIPDSEESAVADVGAVASVILSPVVPADCFIVPASLTPTVTSGASPIIPRTASPATPKVALDTVIVTPAIRPTASPTVVNLLPATSSTVLATDVDEPLAASAAVSTISAASTSSTESIESQTPPPTTGNPASLHKLDPLVFSNATLTCALNTMQTTTSLPTSIPIPATDTVPVGMIRAPGKPGHLVSDEFRLLIMWLEEGRLTGTYPRLWTAAYSKYWNVKGVRAATGKKKFKEHMLDAVDAGIISVAGQGPNTGKIFLHEQWHGFT